MGKKKEEERQRQARISERSMRQKDWKKHRSAWLKEEEDYLWRCNELQWKLKNLQTELESKVAERAQFDEKIKELKAKTDDMERDIRHRRERMTTLNPPSPLTQGGEGLEYTGTG